MYQREHQVNTHSSQNFAWHDDFRVAHAIFQRKSCLGKKEKKIHLARERARRQPVSMADKKLQNNRPGFPRLPNYTTRLISVIVISGYKLYARVLLD